MTLMRPVVGQPAPDFTAEADSGNTITLSQLLGQWVVLYFYPKDNTPGCSKEACSLRDTAAAITTANAVVLGVSTDSVTSHRKFIEKYALPFTLIADTDAAVAAAYGVYGEKVRCGRTSVGITRMTFVIDPDGIIRHVFTKVTVDRHGDEVLAVLNDLGAMAGYTP